MDALQLKIVAIAKIANQLLDVGWLNVRVGFMPATVLVPGQVGWIAEILAIGNSREQCSRFGMIGDGATIEIAVDHLLDACREWFHAHQADERARAEETIRAINQVDDAAALPAARPGV